MHNLNFLLLSVHKVFVEAFSFISCFSYNVSHFFCLFSLQEYRLISNTWKKQQVRCEKKRKSKGKNRHPKYQFSRTVSKASKDCRSQEVGEYLLSKSVTKLNEALKKVPSPEVSCLGLKQQLYNFQVRNDTTGFLTKSTF